MPVDSLSFQTCFGSEAIATLLTSDNNPPSSILYADLSGGLHTIRNTQDSSPLITRQTSEKTAQYSISSIAPSVTDFQTLNNEDPNRAWKSVLTTIALSDKPLVMSQNNPPKDHSPATITAALTQSQTAISSKQGRALRWANQKDEFNRITPDILLDWQANQKLPKNQRLTRAQFMNAHNITATRLNYYIHSSGKLTTCGENFIQRKANHQFNRITPDILSAWSKNQALPETQRLTRVQFTSAHNIAKATLCHYIDSSGKLTVRGENFIRRKTNHQFNRVTPDILLAWSKNQALPETQRLSRTQFTDAYNIQANTLAKYIYFSDGTFTIYGTNILQRAQGHQFTPVTADILNAWQANQQLPENNRLTQAQFVNQHNLLAHTLSQFIYLDGTLKPRSTELLQRMAGHRFKPANKKIAEAWSINNKLPSTQRLTREQFAQKHNVSVRTLKYDIDVNDTSKTSKKNA